MVRLRQANPFDRFQRMGDNDRIVSRYMDDKAFEEVAFGVLSRIIYDAIPDAGR